MTLFFLALRNLTRNKRRTFVTALAIAFGSMAIVFLQAFANGLVRDMVETSALAKTGPIQVFRAGYLGSDDPLKMAFEEDPNLVTRIRAVPGVRAVAPRLEFDGMVSNGSESTMFIATGIDPEVEYDVCPKRKTNVAKGSGALESGESAHALIGKTLAEALGARDGSTLILQAAGPHAGTNALDVSVRGFLPSHHPMESKRLLTVTLDFSQELLRMKGFVTEYVIGITDLDHVDEVAAQVKAAVGDGYQVTTWKDLDPGTRDRVQMFRGILIFVAVVLFLLVATGIVNTMMMSVYERVREIGTMLAIGVRRRRVSAIFLWEAFSLGLASASVGGGAGWALVRGAFGHGIERRTLGADLTTFYPGVSGGFVALVIGFAMMGTVLAASYPAWKASRLHPAAALRAT